MNIDTTIVRIGNSLGSRYPRRALERLQLKEGDRITVSIKKTSPNRKRAIAALEAIAEMNDTLANIDVEAWQQERRDQQQRKDKTLDDILGR